MPYLAGLACNLLGIKNQEQLIHRSYFGGLLENLIFMELLKQNIWSDEQVNLFHFRDKYKAEFNPNKFEYGLLFYSGKEILPFSQNGIQLFALPISILLK